MRSSRKISNATKALILVILVGGFVGVPALYKLVPILTQGALDSDLIHAAMETDNLALTKALKKGAYVNTRSAKGVTALTYSADLGNMEGVKLLLAHGADYKIKTYSGDTPMMAATRASYDRQNIMKKEDYSKILQLLQQAGEKE